MNFMVFNENDYAIYHYDGNEENLKRSLMTAFSISSDEYVKDLNEIDQSKFALVLDVLAYLDTDCNARKRSKHVLARIKKHIPDFPRNTCRGFRRVPSGVRVLSGDTYICESMLDAFDS